MLKSIHLAFGRVGSCAGFEEGHVCVRESVCVCASKKRAVESDEKPSSLFLVFGRC